MLRALSVRALELLVCGLAAVSCVGMNDDAGGNSAEPVGQVRQAATGGAGGEAGAPSGTPCSNDNQCEACEFCAGAPAGTCQLRTAGDVCRAANPNRTCDAAEVCDGIDPLCPANVGLAGGTVCRAKDPTKFCDQQEVCVGGFNLDCPQDIGLSNLVVCRPSAGSCDQIERCRGLVEDCPTDIFRPNNAICNASTDPDCDPEERCDGMSAACPSNVVAAAGTPCDDGDDCTGTQPSATLVIDQCDASGACIPGSPTVCSAISQCHDVGSCDSMTGDCSNPEKPDGTSCTDNVGCTDNDECNNGTCAGTPDDTNCTAHACAIGTCDEDNGCEYVAVDALPVSVCRTSKGSCDVQETCNGTDLDCPSDVVQPASVVCQNAACINNDTAAQVLTRCDGSTPTCAAPADTQCGAYMCANNACRTSCQNDGNCQSAYFCDQTTHQCVARTGGGQPCSTAVECSRSNPYCVDGVCCNAECDGQCEACNITGSLGICTGVSGDPVAPRPACGADGTACDGQCDPSNRTACEYPTTSTQCRAASCDGSTNTALPRAFCDGRGGCNETDGVDCAPYSCGATQCRGNCTLDSHCAAGSFCNAGMCATQGDPGESCDTAAECKSGHCVDGVCCDSACDGQCQACNLSGRAGTCSPATGAPVGGRTACAGSGTCAGQCDGENPSACAYPSASTSCRDASCTDGTATLAAACDGRGSCPALRTQACPSGCEGTICAGDGCVVDADCPMDQHCSAGVCAPKGDPGGQCAADAECASGHCVDGVCCDTSCLGQCEACDVAGSEGTCSPVADGDAPHGARTACTSDNSVCGGTCDGSERNGCSYPVGNECRPGMCAADGAEDVSIARAICVGNGRCPGEVQQGCGQYACDATGTQCDGPCANDATACPGGEYCSAGVCVPEKPTGGGCAADAECASGHCVDGVCCDTICDGQCEACDVSGSIGTCSPVTGNARGGRPACQGTGPCAAQCDGVSGASCNFQDAQTSCGAAYCSNGVHSEAASCDGAGTCAPGATQACESFTCNGAECGNGCATDADCTGSNVCVSLVCQPASAIDAVDKGSCGCRIPGARSSSSWAGFSALLGLFGLFRLRRQRRRSIVASLSEPGP